MAWFKSVASALAVVVAMSTALAVRAGDFKEETSKVTVHVPDAWKKTETKPDDVVKLSMEKGVPTHSDDYYVMTIGHVVTNEDGTVEKFKDAMIKDFPADWKAIEVTKATVGKEKLPALRIPYTFQVNGIPFRLDLFLFQRGRQYTFFQFVGTQKAYDGMNKDLEKIVADADINRAGGK